MPLSRAHVDTPPETISDLRALVPVIAGDGRLRYNDTVDRSHDNNLRAKWAAAAVLTFASETGTDDEDCSTVIGDLLANLRHLCDLSELDFSALSDRGYDHYSDERTGG
jgi:hypothetical protein